MVKSGAADEDGEEDGVKVIKHLVVDNHDGNDHWAAEQFASGEWNEKVVAFQDLIDITLRRMDHDRDGRISFSDFSTTVQVDPLE